LSGNLNKHFAVEEAVDREDDDIIVSTKVTVFIEINISFTVVLKHSWRIIIRYYSPAITF